MSKPSVTIIFVIILVLACSIQMHAQRFLGAVSLGMNLTQVDGDDFYGFHKVGLNVGPMVAVPFGKNRHWSVSMELLYSQKGSYHNGSSDSTTYRLVQDYVEIPVLIHYTDKKIVSGGLGFAYGQRVNYTETENSFYNSVYDYQTDLSINDISVVADVQVRLVSKLWADLRYQYSMKSNRTVVITDPGSYPTTTHTEYQFNNVISIRLTWVFNQEKIVKAPKQTRSGDIF